MTVACSCGGTVAETLPKPARADILLHLPEIHCAGCIAGAEKTLRSVPGVRAARVNLGLKRARVETDGPIDPASLIDALRGAGVEARELDPSLLAESSDRDGSDLLLRLGVAGFAMMNVMLLSVAVWSGASENTERLFHLISAMIAVPAVAYAARPFFVGAISGLRVGRPGMDVPIALAILLATALSLYEALAGGTGHAWFDAALSLTFFLLAGRYLDHRGRAAARSAAGALAALDAPRALRLLAGQEETVASADLVAGDRIRILPGMRAPADGRVMSGSSEIDRSAMTGETAPGYVGQGDEVLAGETVSTGALVVEVQRAGRDTTLARMTDLVAEAEAARGAYLSLADQVARAYVPVVHILAFGAFLGWVGIGLSVLQATGIAVSVLIITCPCALGLAVPAASVAATGRLFRSGLLVKNRTTLERLAEVDTVVFDKTGTLTTGVPEVFAAPQGNALQVAVALAMHSAHPMSRAILAYGRALSVTPADVSNPEEVPGIGVRGVWRGRCVSLGCGGASEETTAWLDIGDGGARPFVFRETLRVGAQDAVQALRSRGLRVLMLSGDNAAPVDRIAAALGIEKAESGMTPEAKVAVLRGLSGDGHKVLMIGDGLNDTAALAEAHAAISPGTALDAPRNAADIVLLSDSLAPVPEALEIAKQARTRMRENIAIAVVYNFIAIPVALAGLATPLLAALAMSASSVTVSLNAARLAR